MPAVLTTFAEPDGSQTGEWGWTCAECKKQRAGCRSTIHAINSANLHNREQHPEPELSLTRAATELLRLRAKEQARGIPDARVAGAMIVWSALCGIPDHAAALQFAEACAERTTVAHLAPF